MTDTATINYRELKPEWTDVLGINFGEKKYADLIQVLYLEVNTLTGMFDLDLQ